MVALIRTTNTLLIQKTETEAFLTSVSWCFYGTFYSLVQYHRLNQRCWFLFRLLYECDYCAVKKMAIFVDILVGVERKSRIWRVGFISIAVLTVSEAEISEFLQIYVSFKDEFSVFSDDHMRFVTRNLDYGVNVLVLPDAVQYALIYRYIDHVVTVMRTHRLRAAFPEFYAGSESYQYRHEDHTSDKNLSGPHRSQTRSRIIVPYAMVRQPFSSTGISANGSTVSPRTSPSTLVS